MCPVAALKKPFNVPVMISASPDDDRVSFSGTLKWIEHARSMHCRQDTIFLNQTGGGHFGYQADIHTTIVKEITYMCKHLKTPSQSEHL